MKWSVKMYLPINPTKRNYPTIGLEAPLRLSIFPDGSGIDLGVQTYNMFFPSAQCTEAANKARRLISMIRRSFQSLSKSAFIPLYEALVRPHLGYEVPACSPNLVAGSNHLERLQR